MSNDKEYSDDIIASLKKVRDTFDKEDTAVRTRQIIQWKKLEYMWEGFQRIWWSEIAHDWRVFDAQNTEGFSDQAGFYDKPINVFRAYLETIIAAMSAAVPTIKCTPDDADNTDDVLTAKGGNKIFELIYKHNDAPLLWMHALYIYCTQGMIAAYNYPDSDESYGTNQTPKYEDQDEQVTEQICPICKHPLEGPDLEKAIAEDMQMDPQDEFDADPEEDVICHNCQAKVKPETNTQTIKVKKMVGVTSEPKTRQCIEVYGGLYVKIPNYAKEQKDLPYLKFSKEKHFSIVLSEYPNLIDNKKVTSGSSGPDLYERWGRLSPQYAGEYPIDTPTCNHFWFRPCAFNVLTDEDERKELLKEFPNGVKATWVNDEFAHCCPESLDDHWTLTKNPLSEYLHFNPLGDLAVSVQEITNDLIALILQTIEHGIPQTFFDSKVLNADNYKQLEVAPGAMIPAVAKSGKSLQDGFYTVKTATLSQEVMPFGEKIQELGQFATGALPSLYGGDQGNSSRTAAQYSMSRAQSLQRLQVAWKMLNFWWKNIFGKVIPQYIKTMGEEEKIVQSQGNNYIQTIVNRSEMNGKLGDMELESSDQFPFEFGQRRDVIMQLLQSTNPEVLNALADPNNLPLIAEAIGLNDFALPGEHDREKQFEEIALLLRQEPVSEQMPSIMPDLDVDNHKIEADICRSWLVSEVGRQTKVMNKLGYMNVLLHMKAHVMLMGPPEPIEPNPGANAGQAQPKAPQAKPPMSPMENNNNGQ